MDIPDSAYADIEHDAFRRDGAVRLHAALSDSELGSLIDFAKDFPTGRAGIRLHDRALLSRLLDAGGCIGTVAAALLGASCKPVRAILFDKTPSTNWSLGWHQDRTIAVVDRVDAPGFGPWTVKAGVHHVVPPIGILNGMLTLRVHLDPVPMENAPLLIAPGSHCLGLVAEPEIPGVVRRCGTMACTADAGDVWIYATPILHASDAALAPIHRRVLQVDYAACDLPHGLAWRGT